MSDWGFQFRTDSGKWFQLDDISPCVVIRAVGLGYTTSYSTTLTEVIGRNVAISAVYVGGGYSNWGPTPVVEYQQYTYDSSTGVFNWRVISTSPPSNWSNPIQLTIFCRFLGDI